MRVGFEDFEDEGEEVAGDERGAKDYILSLELIQHAQTDANSERMKRELDGESDSDDDVDSVKI